MTFLNWKLEDDVNDYVKSQLEKLGLKKLTDYNVESSMSDYLKEALKGSAKTANKTNFGKPDFHLEKYKPKDKIIPIIIENKLSIKKLVSENKDGVKFDDKSIANFAVNGALYYARNIIASHKYDEVIAIGCAGDSQNNAKIQVYYVFGTGENAFKLIETCTAFDFLENQKAFGEFYKNAVLTEDDKHRILINSQVILKSYAKALNKLMHNHNITAPQRVLYVSGMLLAMQDTKDSNGNIIDGLTPNDLKGFQTANKRDGILIFNQINEFLIYKQINENKKSLMLASFNEIAKQPLTKNLFNEFEQKFYF